MKDNNLKNKTFFNPLIPIAAGEHLVANQLLFALRNEFLEKKFPYFSKHYPHDFGIFILLFDSWDLTFSYRGTLYPFTFKAISAFENENLDEWSNLFEGIEDIKDNDIKVALTDFYDTLSKDALFWQRTDKLYFPDPKRLVKDVGFIFRNLKNLNALQSYYKKLRKSRSRKFPELSSIKLVDLFHLDFLTILHQLKQHKDEGLSSFCYEHWKELKPYQDTFTYYFPNRLEEEKHAKAYFKVMSAAERLIGVGRGFGHLLASILRYGQLKGEVFFVDRINLFEGQSSQLENFRVELEKFLERVDIAAAIGDIWQSRLLQYSEPHWKEGYPDLLRSITYLAALRSLTIYTLNKNTYHAEISYELNEDKYPNKFFERQIDKEIDINLFEKIKQEAVLKDKSDQKKWYLYFPNGGVRILEIEFLREKISESDVRYFYLRLLSFGIQLRQTQEATLNYDRQKEILQNVRHEIQNSLNCIQSEILSLRYIPTDSSEYDERLKVVENRIILTTELTTLSNDKLEKLPTDIPADLVNLIKHLTNLTSDRYSPVNLEIFPSKLNYNLSITDLGSVYRLFFNLIDNAKKAKRNGYPKPYVKIEINKKDKTIVVKIENPVPFIPELKKLIRLNYDADPDEYIVGGMRRLGLLHCKISARRLGWQLDIQTENEYTAGTLVTVVIPLESRVDENG